jgi:hypothetical protein
LSSGAVLPAALLQRKELLLQFIALDTLSEQTPQHQYSALLRND